VAGGASRSRARGARSGRARIAREARRVLLYGATGYTGALVARAAVSRDLPLVLAGRTADRLAGLGDELGCPFRVAALDSPGELRAALAGVGVVVNAAGPFSATSRHIVEACLTSGVHYLDISGEVGSMEAVLAYDRAAREAGVMLMPGVGFDVVPSDCLAARVKRRLPDARSLRIGVAGLNLVSRGSARTILEQMGQGVRICRDGELATMPEGLLERSFDFGDGARSCTGVSWGDVVTAHHTTGIPNVEVYFDATPPVRAYQLMGRAWGLFPGASALSQLWMRPWLALQPEGPTATERAAHRAVIVVQAETEGGRRVESRVGTPEVYTFTSICASAIAQRVLDGEARAGFQTPAGLFGETLIESFDDVVVDDAGPADERGRHR
jgi:short subunit dehydrogenase-like uncharacterized protein